MELQEVLWDLLSEAKCPDGFPDANNEERATHVAPIIERALRAERMVGYRIGCETPKGFYTLNNIEDMPPTAGVAAMMAQPEKKEG